MFCSELKVNKNNKRAKLKKVETRIIQFFFFFSGKTRFLLPITPGRTLELGFSEENQINSSSCQERKPQLLRPDSVHGHGPCPEESTAAVGSKKLLQ